MKKTLITEPHIEFFESEREALEWIHSIDTNGSIYVGIITKQGSCVGLVEPHDSLRWMVGILP